jgi:hypothetical protein
MAVLNLLLAGNTQARRCRSWPTWWRATAGRRAQVPAGAVPHDRRARHGVGHPRPVRRLRAQEAPRRPRCRASTWPKELFKDARSELRQRRWVTRPSSPSSTRGRWWMAAMRRRWWLGRDSMAAGMRSSFEAAMLEPPKGEERSRLVGDLITQFFSAYRSLAGSGESFVPLDDGLSIMSRHAKALGYDAVILFLDELVLWLASHAADVSFVSREGTKLVKLVEATNADRPIPLVSFVARQRDLRDLVGENLAGSRARAVQRRAQALGGALPPHHAGRPQPARHCREARAAPVSTRRAADAGVAPSTTCCACARTCSTRLLTTDGRPRHVPQGLPVLAGAGADADRGVGAAAARAHGAEADAAVAGGPARRPGAGPADPRWATCGT